MRNWRSAPAAPDPTKDKKMDGWIPRNYITILQRNVTILRKKYQNFEKKFQNSEVELKI